MAAEIPQLRELAGLYFCLPNVYLFANREYAPENPAARGHLTADLEVLPRIDKSFE
jgi:hypothetical protein